MDKAVIVARVSTINQEEDGYSTDAQAEFLTTYCQRMGLEVVKTLKIAETASKHEERHKFNATMDLMTKRKIPNLVIEKVDRAARNSKSAIQIDEWLADDEVRKLHLPKNGLVLHKNSPSTDRLVWDMHISIAKWYANNLREEVKKGVQEKLNQGWYPGTNPPIGYKHTGDKGHKIQVIDESKAPLVKLAFELYDTGNYSVYSLAEELKNQGLTNRYGEPLSKSYVHDLLRNKFYIGIMTWCGEEYAGSYLPIIDKDLFERVNSRLSSGTSPVVAKHNTLLKGKVKCGSCGSTVSWYKQKGNWYGECKSKKKCDSKGTIRQDSFEIELVNYFNELIAPSPAIIAWVKKELRQSHNKEKEAYEASLGQYKQRVSKLESQITFLYDDRLDGRITPEKYDELLKSKRTEIERIENRIDKLRSDNADYINQAIDILEVTQNAAQIFNNSSVEKQRVLIGDIFSGITLNNKCMNVEWRPETELVRKAASKTRNLEKFLEPVSDPYKKHLSEEVRSTWLRRLDSNQRPRS